MLLWVMRLAAADHRLAKWEELLDELTPRQVTTLMAFERVEKWGEEREDNRRAIEIASVCSAASMSGKPVAPLKILELLRPRAQHKSEYTSPNKAAAMMSRVKPKAKPSGDRR